VCVQIDASCDRREREIEEIRADFPLLTASRADSLEKKCWRYESKRFYLRFRSGTLQPTNHFGGATMPGPKKPARKATKRRKTTKRRAVAKSPAKKAAKKRSAKKGRKSAKKRAPARKTAAKRSGAKKGRKTARKAGRKGAKKGAKRASKKR
jgi:hypothetical protein